MTPALELILTACAAGYLAIAVAALSDRIPRGVVVLVGSAVATILLGASIRVALVQVPAAAFLALIVVSWAERGVAHIQARPGVESRLTRRP